MAPLTKYDWIRGDLVPIINTATHEPEDEEEMAPYERELGSITAKMENMEVQMNAMSQDLREMRDFMRDAKTGWKVLTTVSAIGGAVGAAAVKFFPLFIMLPK